jgi:ABC-type transport system involved in multi-copper enzyme maturation permease subunit
MPSWRSSALRKEEQRLRDSLIVLRKELLEIVGDRHSTYGLLIQGGIVFLLCGIVIPVASGASWDKAGQLTMLYCGFPGAVAAMVAADAFSGERERRTLETLLATPLRASSIFLGKIASAATFAVTVSWASVLTAIVAANTKSGMASLLLPRPEELFWVAGVSLAFSLLTASLAAGISLHLTVARSAQQVASMLSVALAIGGSALFGDQVIGWTTALMVQAALFGAAAVAALLIMSTFRRERLLGVS